MRRVLSSILGVLAVASALAIVLMLVSILAVQEGSAGVARAGQVAVLAEANLGSASAAQNGAAHAVVLEQGRAGGWVEDSRVRSATDQLELLVGEHDRRLVLLTEDLDGTEAASVLSAGSVFVADLELLIDGLSLTPQDGLARVTAIPTVSYESAIAEVITVRDERLIGSLVEAEYAGQVADAVRFLVIVVIPVAAMFILRSVMRRRREREGLRSELLRQDAVIASKDEFVANLSHELRTPLTGVYGFALALDESGFDDTDTAAELTSMIVNDAAELSRMVDDLITAGQVETDNVVFSVEDVRISPEIEAVIEPFVRTGASIAFTGSDDVAEVDRLRFRQVVRNLVSNAAKHGGPNIEIFTEYGGGTVSVFVMDDGDGIADENVASIFDRYQHEGTGPLLQGSVGLGLAIARALAIGMGGNLTYTRTNGLTYFVFRVPSHRVARLNERVIDQSLGDESAAQSVNEVAKLFAR